MGKGPEQMLLQGRHTDGQQTYEKMLDVTKHQKMQIKTTGDITSHLSEWLSSINQQTTSAGEDVEKMGNLSALLAGMQTGAATVENSMEFLQKSKNGTAF